jgi:hypothetical protein
MVSLMAILGLIVAGELTVSETTIEQGALRSAGTESGKPPPPELDTDALSSVADVIAARPLLSPSRRPFEGPSEPRVAASDDSEHGLPRLAGTIIGPNGGRAIFAGADGKSHTAAEGDAIGAFKVRTINPGLVTLSGSDGDRVLRPAYVASPGTNGGVRAQEGARVTSPGANGGVRTQERAR